MRGIKKRQKGFVALLLAVVIGLLPSVSVWAMSNTLEVNGNDDSGTNYSIKWNDNNIVVNTSYATGGDTVFFTSSATFSSGGNQDPVDAQKGFLKVNYVDKSNRSLCTFTANKYVDYTFKVPTYAQVGLAADDQDEVWTVSDTSMSNGSLEYITLKAKVDSAAAAACDTKEALIN